MAPRDNYLVEANDECEQRVKKIVEAAVQAAVRPLAEEVTQLAEEGKTELEEQSRTVQPVAFPALPTCRIGWTP